MVASAPLPIHIERDVPCPLRDGTVLRADVFRPEGPGPFPVVLLRTPYDKAQMALPPAGRPMKRGSASARAAPGFGESLTPGRFVGVLPARLFLATALAALAAFAYAVTVVILILGLAVVAVTRWRSLVSATRSHRAVVVGRVVAITIAAASLPNAVISVAHIATS